MFKMELKKERTFEEKTHAVDNDVCQNVDSRKSETGKEMMEEWGQATETFSPTKPLPPREKEDEPELRCSGINGDEGQIDRDVSEDGDNDPEDESCNEFMPMRIRKRFCHRMHWKKAWSLKKVTTVYNWDDRKFHKITYLDPDSCDTNFCRVPRRYSFSVSSYGYYNF